MPSPRLEPGNPNVQEALSVDAEVVCESGRWVVYLNVVLASGAVRKQVGDFHDERRATHAARIHERNARRFICAPPAGPLGDNGPAQEGS